MEMEMITCAVCGDECQVAVVEVDAAGVWVWTRDAVGPASVPEGVEVDAAGVWVWTWLCEECAGVEVEVEFEAVEEEE